MTTRWFWVNNWEVTRLSISGIVRFQLFTHAITYSFHLMQSESLCYGYDDWKIWVRLPGRKQLTSVMSFGKHTVLISMERLSNSCSISHSWETWTQTHAHNYQILISSHRLFRISRRAFYLYQPWLPSSGVVTALQLSFLNRVMRTFTKTLGINMLLPGKHLYIFFCVRNPKLKLKTDFCWCKFLWSNMDCNLYRTWHLKQIICHFDCTYTSKTWT